MISDMNIPIAVFCFIMILFTLRVPTPPGTVREKLRMTDWGYVYKTIVCLSQVTKVNLVVISSSLLALLRVVLA